MARPRKVDRPHRLEVKLPMSVYGPLALELYSELEGGIPYGAVSELISQLVTEWLKARGALV